ncbi:VWA domain-containing protein [Panacibacter ginsenosidivorans]|uniref:VWA domain-containing protein n=1 Tax=Panacibacter ginsenosidivorans TaxID=1813871 RepID=A0A5B8VBT7_9BACT|nr:VWA domain-containing protein [Panacibacter ginsenosidivorans]QEC68782.1 VWA domain-containing protein [Panacibacter ginsenosidivorans]
MISFQNIEFLSGLLLLIPLVVIFILVLRWKRKTTKALGDETLVSKLTAGYSAKLYKVKFVAVLVALALCIVAATNVRTPLNSGKEQTAGIDIMVALDVSKSMLSNDIKPSRLERARQLVSMLIDQSDNNRVGLVLFAGKAYLQMPLTADLAEAKLFLSNASVDAVPVQGTNISEALQLCNNALDTKEKKHKAVVLISDGEDHDAGAEKTAVTLADNGAIVYTVGIGTAEGSTITEPGTGTLKTDRNGKTVISKLNEEELKQIAGATGGNYFHMEDVTKTVTEVSSALNGIEKKLVESGGERSYLSISPFIIAIALLLLVVEIFIPERKKTKSFV